MVDLIDLTEAFAATLQAIPEVVTLLGGDPAAIVPYIDNNPDQNSVSAATYEMKPGSILVVHISTQLAQGQTMAKWMHSVHFLLKAASGESTLRLANAIVDGAPNPGDGQIWRRCAIMDGLDPTEVIEISRETDTEGIDYHLIKTETTETGDYK